MKQIIIAAMLLGAAAAPATAQVPGSLGDADFVAYANGLMPTGPSEPATAPSYFANLPLYVGGIRPDGPDITVDSRAARAAVVTPEPASVVLLATGLAGIAALSRRRRKG